MDERLAVLEGRMLEIERTHSKLMTTVLVTEAHVQGLIQTQKSRFDAFDMGIKMILTRLEDLEAIKNQAIGAVWLARILGITGIVGGVIAIIQMVRG